MTALSLLACQIWCKLCLRCSFQLASRTFRSQHMQSKASPASTQNHQEGKLAPTLKLATEAARAFAPRGNLGVSKIRITPNGRALIVWTPTKKDPKLIEAASYAERSSQSVLSRSLCTAAESRLGVFACCNKTGPPRSWPSFWVAKELNI